MNEEGIKVSARPILVLTWFLLFSVFMKSIIFLFLVYLQLSELGRPFTGGSWCGKATGPQLYFSETSTVTASVKVSKIMFCSIDNNNNYVLPCRPLM